MDVDFIDVPSGFGNMMAGRKASAGDRTAPAALAFCFDAFS
jgi:hypothetical protein